MHVEAWMYTVAMLARIGGAAGRRVLEIGSVNINGSARDLCGDAAAYVGIDREAGPGVDVVIDAANYDGAAAFDLVICNEVLEHAPDPGAVIACAARALAVGGHLILTAAGDGRKPHGARGAEHPDPGEHYRNIGTDELRALLDGWNVIDLSHIATPGDVRALARWKG